MLLLRAILAASLTVLPWPVHAAPPSLEAVERLIAKLMVHLYDVQQANAIGAKFSAEQDQTIASLTGPCIDEQSRRELDEVKRRYSSALAEMMAWERHRPRYIAYFQQALTDDEATAVLAFLDSPNGQAIFKIPPLRDIGAPRFSEEDANRLRSDRNRDLDPIIRRAMGNPLKCGK